MGGKKNIYDNCKNYMVVKLEEKSFVLQFRVCYLKLAIAQFRVCYLEQCQIWWLMPSVQVTNTV